MRKRLANPEVWVAVDDVVAVALSDVEHLKLDALKNRRRRVRLCAHHDDTDQLHEMIIVHTREAYVRPHKHRDRVESIHIMEGQGELILLAEDGTITNVIAMGEYDTGRTMFCRMGPTFHTLRIRSDSLVFHETTTGPFRRQDTVFASWAPSDDDQAAVKRYLARLDSEIACWTSAIGCRQ